MTSPAIGHTARAGASLGLALLFALAGCQQETDLPAEPPTEPSEKTSGDVAVREIALGDVLMRSLRPWPKNDADTKNTINTAQAFHVDHIVWIYENDADFNKQVQNAGMEIGTTMAANAREAWSGILSKEEIDSLVARFTIRGLNQEQILYDHFKKFGPSAWTQHFIPDQTNPDWREYYINYLVGLYSTGISTIHRDDPGSNWWAARAGGNFTDRAIEFFRDYLAANFSKEELQELGVDEVSTFDVRKHFLSLGASDGNFYTWRGSPLRPIFEKAMLEADRRFFLDVKSAVEERTGRRIPWSLNTAGAVLPFEEAFDFRISEFQAHHNQPRTILAFRDYALDAGILQAWVTMVQRDYAEDPAWVGNTRRNIATMYATGMLPLVPWDMYMHDAPRYYGSPREFGDLFAFVAANRGLLDDHDRIAESGIDLQSSIYQWLPNKELRQVFAEGASAVWINKANIFAFIRAKKDRSSVVVHLVDWNPSSSSFEIAFSPAGLIGTQQAELTLLRPGHDPVHFHHYAGESIEIPSLGPWGILVVKPDTGAASHPVAPQLVAPARSVIPVGSELVFVPPSNKEKIQFRILPIGSRNGDTLPEFEGYDPADPPRILRDGTLEAFTVGNNGKQSKPLRVLLRTFQDHRVSSKIQPAPGEGIDLCEKFRPSSGEIKVGASFLSNELRLGGQLVPRGISTSGNSRITAEVDPSWKFFTGRVGIDDAEDRRPCARFQIQKASRVVFPFALAIPEGTKSIALRTVGSGFFPDHNHTVWAGLSATTSGEPPQ
jgi:hypothetical protein